MLVSSTFYSALPRLTSRTVRTLKSTVLPEDHFKIKSLHDKLAPLEKDFDRAVGVEALTLARKNGMIHHGYDMCLSSLTYNLDAAEMDSLLRRLKPIDEANYQKDRGCMEGTRTAVLDNIITWVKETHDLGEASKPHSNSVYWLYGIPGLGKTSVANSLFRRLHKSGNLGGSFLCRRDEEVLRDPKNILPTLISKLAETWTPYRILVAKVLQDDPHLNSKSTDGELLLKSLQALKTSPPRTLVLVIDALDECGDDTTRKDILKSLFEACSQVSWLKIFITSRPEHDIRSFFEARVCPGQDLSRDDQNDKDIRHFTQERMLSLAKSRKRQPGWPGQARLSRIIQRSHGLFIYVETIYRFLKPLKNADEKLDLLLGEKEQDANSELHKLYLAALKSQVGEETEEFCRVARAIIAVATYRPLGDEPLASLMDKDLFTVQAWVDALGWVFYREQSQAGGIRIRHLSILEFLTGLSNPDLRVDLKRADEDLSHYCLKTMVKGLRFNICGLETSYLANCDIENHADRVRNNISDALQYSCMHWADHLCSDLGPPNEAISNLLNEFFGGVWPLYWLEVLSITGNVPAAITVLQTITESNKVCSHCLHGYRSTKRKLCRNLKDKFKCRPRIYCASCMHSRHQSQPARRIFMFLHSHSRLWSQVCGRMCMNHFQIS